LVQKEKPKNPTWIKKKSSTDSFQVIQMRSPPKRKNGGEWGWGGEDCLHTGTRLQPAEAKTLWKRESMRLKQMAYSGRFPSCNRLVTLYSRFFLPAVKLPTTGSIPTPPGLAAVACAGPAALSAIISVVRTQADPTSSWSQRKALRLCVSREQRERKQVLAVYVYIHVAISYIHEHIRCTYTAAVFFVANFSHFAKNILKKEYSVTKSVFFLKKTFKISKIAKNRHNCLQVTTWSGLKDFSTLIFWNRQIWLNVIMDDCHLSNINHTHKTLILEVFLMSILCDVAKVAMIHKEDLAKFGY
jgi:hypothetical protein